MANCTVPDIPDKNTTGDTSMAGASATKSSLTGRGPRTSLTPSTGSMVSASTTSVTPTFRPRVCCRQSGF